MTKDMSRRALAIGLAQAAVFLWSHRAMAQLNAASLLGAGLSDGQMGLGMKDLLKVTSSQTISKLGRPNGFMGDPAVRIPLPGPLQQVQQPLAMAGAGGMLDDLTRRMNRGAEQAMPKAGSIFANAANNVTFDDARQILTGPQDSVTQYFRRSSSDQLTSAFTPVMGSALKGSGAMNTMQSVQKKVQGIPGMGMLGGLSGLGGGLGGGQRGGGNMLSSLMNFDLTGFATAAALNGVFHYMGQQEADIRANPAARSTGLLRQLFQ